MHIKTKGKKTLKTFFVGLLLSCQALIMFACSGTEGKSNTEIISDMEQWLKQYNTTTVENIEIVDRNTDTDVGTDNVVCKVASFDECVKYIKYYTIMYTLGKDEWVLSTVNKSHYDKWEQLPAKGVEESDVLKTLLNETILIDEEVWTFAEGVTSIKSIISHETDLENKKDVITAEVMIEDIVEQAIGQVTIEYSYNNSWNNGTILKTENFETMMKPTIDFNVAEDDLIAQLEKNGFYYGEKRNFDSYQYIEIIKSQISKFKVDNEDVKNKGSVHEYTCSFTLTTNYVIFDLQFKIIYTYSKENGWIVEVNPVKKAAKVEGILGEWKGTYSEAFEDGIASLNITEFKDDGTVKGIFSFARPDGDYGSYSVEGTLDLSRLEFIF